MKTGALSIDRGGIVHAFRFTGSRNAHCGWRRFNFNKLIDMEPYKSDCGGFEYTPPTDVFVTCLQCLAAEGVSA